LKRVIPGNPGYLDRQKCGDQRSTTFFSRRGAMDSGQKGVFWFTDALTSTQLIELAQRTEQLG
jgi:hypothetical protein